MKKLEIDQMSAVAGGAVSEDTYNKIWGVSCGLAFGGITVGLFGLAVTGVIFGPTCLGLAVIKFVG